MNQQNERHEKRPRLRQAPKSEAVFSTDRPKTRDVINFFADNLFKKKVPFTR